MWDDNGQQNERTEVQVRALIVFRPSPRNHSCGTPCPLLGNTQCPLCPDVSPSPRLTYGSLDWTTHGYHVSPSLGPNFIRDFYFTCLLLALRLCGLRGARNRSLHAPLPPHVMNVLAGPDWMSAAVCAGLRKLPASQGCPPLSPEAKHLVSTPNAPPRKTISARTCTLWNVGFGIRRRVRGW